MTKDKQKVLYLNEKSIELIEINGDGLILSNAKVLLKPGVVEHGLVAQPDKYKAFLEKTFTSAKPAEINKDNLNVVFSAEDFIFTTITADKNKDALKLIKKELSGSLDDWCHGVQIFYHPENDYKTLVLTAVKRDLILQWHNGLKASDVLFDDFIPDYVGLLACVEQSGLQAILDIGDEYSKLIITLDGKIIWGENLPFGEKRWWRLINDFNDLDEKEIVKLYPTLVKQKARKGSLSEQVVNGFEQLYELVDAGLNDFKKFYGKKVDNVYLFGQMAGIKNIDTILSKKLKTPVNIGFCPAKKIKSQNFVRTWGAAKILLNSSIYKISMARTSHEKISLNDEDEDSEVSKPVATKIKNRSIDAAVHNGHVKQKKSSATSVIIVLLFLFVLTAASIWFYSNWQGNQPVDVNENNTPDTTAQVETKTVNTEIRFSFTADTVDASGQRLARTVKVQTTSKATSTDEGLALASADLAEDEALWPVMFGNDTWLIYRQPLLQTAAQDYLQSLQPTSTNKVVVNSIVPKRISAGKSEGEFLVVATVEVKVANDLSLNLPENQDLLVSTTTTTSTKDSLQDNELVVANTPAGWANVRSGAGLQNKIVGKVNDGEKYKILEQQNEWYRIKLSSGEDAWVIKKYTTVK